MYVCVCGVCAERPADCRVKAVRVSGSSVAVAIAALAVALHSSSSRYRRATAATAACMELERGLLLRCVMYGLGAVGSSRSCWECWSVRSVRGGGLLLHEAG